MLCIFFCVVVKAQFTLEHTYPDAQLNLYMVDLEVAGKKYIQIKRYQSGEVDTVTQLDRKVILYNLDHTVWKEIDLNFMPFNYSTIFNSNTFTYDTTYYSYYEILYVSQHLFDSDDEVELMACLPSAIYGQPRFTYIVNEDSGILFSVEDFLPVIKQSVPQAFRPIYNTPLGTKMILTYMGTNASINDVRVYSIPGTLGTSTDIMPIAAENNDVSMSIILAPNPSNGVTKIQYNLPVGQTEGIIEIWSITGQLIRTLSVNGNSNYIELSGNDLSSGMYLVSLTCNSQKLIEKMLRVN